MAVVAAVRLAGEDGGGGCIVAEEETAVEAALPPAVQRSSLARCNCWRMAQRFMCPWEVFGVVNVLCLVCYSKKKSLLSGNDSFSEIDPVSFSEPNSFFFFVAEIKRLGL